jgi:hypothetical protein
MFRLDFLILPLKENIFTQNPPVSPFQKGGVVGLG